MLSNSIFDMSVFEDMRTHELIGWLLDTAGKQEKDPIFGEEDRPKWVAGPPEFRGHASALSQKSDAAKKKDIQLMKDFEQERASTVTSIHINAAYVVMRAHHSQEHGILEGKGYEFKEKTRKPRGASPSVSSLPLKVTARRGDKEGSAVLAIERDPGAGIYEVQFCIGVPTGEESWQPLGSYKKVRIFLDHLQRAGWYYFRVRSHSGLRKPKPGTEFRGSNAKLTGCPIAQEASRFHSHWLFAMPPNIGGIHLEQVPLSKNLRALSSTYQGGRGIGTVWED